MYSVISRLVPSAGLKSLVDLSNETLAALTVMGRKIRIVYRQEKEIFVNLEAARIA